MPYLVLVSLAAALSAFFTPVVRRVAVMFGAIDRPGVRRVHAAPVPRLGGLAILAASLATIAATPILGVDVPALLAAAEWRLGWLLAGAVLAVAAGFVDDVRGLDPLPKLALTTGAAVLALGGGFGFAGFTNPLTGSYVPFGALGGLATVLWIVAVTHAFNLVDGLDGLAAGVALIASLTLLAVSVMEGRAEAGLVWAVLVGALLGFLPYNFHPASIFLGDSGSLLLGYLLAVLALQSLEKGATLVIALVPVLALGLPVTEIVSTVFRRTRAAGAGSVFRADRDHIHHRLLGRGLTHRDAVVSLYAVCIALGGLAFTAVLVQSRPATATAVALGGVGIWAGILRLGRRAPGPSK